MREIRFRAWDKKRKEIVNINGSDLYLADGEVHEIYESRFGDQRCMEDTDVSERYEVMQYTGLKDKNEKEIYEGDVIQFLWEEDSCWGKAGTYKGYIGFNDGAFEVIYIGREDITTFEDGYWHENSKSDDMQSFISWSEQIEVIGNIYENPELLE